MKGDPEAANVWGRKHVLILHSQMCKSIQKTEDNQLKVTFQIPLSHPRGNGLRGSENQEESGQETQTSDKGDVTIMKLVCCQSATQLFLNPLLTMGQCLELPVALVVTGQCKYPLYIGGQ